MNMHGSSIIFVLDWQDLSLCVVMKLLKLECENASSSQQSHVFPLHVFKVGLLYGVMQ